MTPAREETEILPREAAEAAQRGDVALVDVREPWEWEAGRVAGSLHVPMGELGARFGELPDDRPLVVVCRSGARSDAVAAALRDTGRPALNLVGGLQLWSAQGLPLDPPDGYVA